jgi:uncharacterized phage-associated protein
MAVSVLSVARTLGRLSGWNLSNLEMQKIAFIAEMLHLGREDSPLINEQWQAWSYGPVQPDLYHRAKIFGADPVKDIFFDPVLPESTSRGKAVADAYNLMKNLRPGQMINITHQPNGAWASAYDPNIKGRTIPRSSIKAEYSTLIKNDD